MEKKTVEDFFRVVGKIKKEYDTERNKDRFNIFYALHKWHDEVNLHSRFISYLLCPNSGHKIGNTFAKLFVRDFLKISEDNFNLNEYEVYPNEFSKSEFKEIDILLINKSKKQAIIIENKIFAKDSNHKGKTKGYNGQLERYYNTIKKGIDSNGKKCTKYKCDTISGFYLSIDKEPSEESIGMLKDEEDVNVKTIFYRKEIVKWLDECKKVAKDEFQEKIIHQYLILVKNMTKTNFNNEEVLKIKEIIGQNQTTTKYIIDNFNHVKWHTVHQFWVKLQKELSKEYQSAKLYFDGFESFEQAITELTHHKKNVNLGITFSNDKNNFYISAFNILSWGILEKNSENKEQKKWGYFKNIPIIFSDFSQEETFKLIEEENTAEIINNILDEIEEEIINNFTNLKNQY